jgi:hypothetical protein
MKPHVNKTIILSALFFLFFATALSAEIRIYKERTGNKVVSHYFDIQRTETGTFIQLKTDTGTASILQTFQLDQNMASLSWSYHDETEKTKVSATRNGNIIVLEGHDRGKPIKKTFKVNPLPWNQTFNIGLEPFSMKVQKKMKFWAIGVKGPGNMKITKFNVKRKKTETITLTTQSQPIESEYITISLSGLLSMFWTGKYWYRKSDGIFLRYKGKNKMGAPITVMELESIN